MIFHELAHFKAGVERGHDAHHVHEMGCLYAAIRNAERAAAA